MEQAFEIHIGKTIRRILNKQGITTSQLAIQLGVDPSAVRKMTRKKYLHSRLMLEISRALDHDLFQYLYQPNEWPANKQLQQKVKELEKEIAALKRENELLNELRKKNNT